MKRIALSFILIFLIIGMTVPGCNGGSDSGNGNGGNGYVPPPPPAQYTLSTSVNPSGAGTVTPSSGTYEEGTQVTLTATPASGYTFDYWGDDASGSSATINVIIDSDRSVVAHFKAPAYLLQLSGPVPPSESLWGRDIGPISIDGTTIPEGVFLFIMGSATNIGSETLTVLVVMKCWSGDTLVKTEEYVVGIILKEEGLVFYDYIEPGDSFEFNIQTVDDPTVDNVTVEFEDISGNEIPFIEE